MRCQRCGKEKAIIAKRLCRSCYDSQPHIMARRIKWNREHRDKHNAYARTSYYETCRAYLTPFTIRRFLNARINT